VAQPARLAGWVVRALVAAATLGCAGAPATLIDAGAEAGPEVGLDVRPRSCLLGTICADDANAVRRCNADGTEGAIIEDCGVAGACSFGRCTSTACLLVEGQATAVGCLFYGSEVADVTCDACESCYRCQRT